MKVSFILAFLIIGFGVKSQVAEIDTIDIKVINGQGALNEFFIQYPVVKTKNATIDSLINYDLKNQLTGNEYPEGPIDSTLMLWASYGLAAFDFDITYNKNEIISLNTTVEGCGAYCTSYTEYYNYSLKTGLPVSITSIVDTTGAFREMVIQEKTKQYQDQKEELKEILEEDEDLEDDDTYDWALEYYEDCEHSFNLETFALYEDHLEIIKPCYLPNVIKALTPYLDLSYDYADIKEYLEIDLE